METKFLARLQKLGYDVRQRRALASLTIANAARFLARGCPLTDFFEEVEYHGRRLAKLNLPPSAVTEAMAEFDKLLLPVLRRLLGSDHKSYAWVREQLQFCVMLTLNNAYYQVREAETQAFYEMFWAELKSHNLDELLERLLTILARSCRADQAHLFLVDPTQATFVCRASYGAALASPVVSKAVSLAKLRSALLTPSCFAVDPKAAKIVLDPSWPGAFSTCWSVPLTAGKNLVGVLQFGFVRPYDWLPREQELLTAAAERCTLAIEKVQLMEHLSMQQEQIRSLAEGMMHVEEVERRRISRELHDQTGQDLLWIRLQMEMLENQLADADQKSRLAEIRDMTERTIIEIRRLIAALSPAVLDQLGLPAALRQLLNRFRNAHSAKTKLHIGKLGQLPRQLEIIAYRLTQECLNNIAKHSSCAHVNLSLTSADSCLKLTVEDDGVGFKVEDAVNKPGSFGLAGIRERVAFMGGRCEITSHPRQPEAKNPVRSGTRIHVELPIQSRSTRVPAPDRSTNMQPGRQPVLRKSTEEPIRFSDSK